jgi:cyclic beta-1,2-glucan synthetase
MKPISAGEFFADRPDVEFASCDRLTRARYLDSIHEISTWSAVDPLTVAERALNLARRSRRGPANCLGYYLIGPGRAELEQEVGARPPRRERALRWLRRNAVPAFLISVCALWAAAMGAATGLLSNFGLSFGLLLTMAALASVPAARIATMLTQFAFRLALPPKPLPRLDFSGGIPPEWRTAMIFPSIVTSREDVDEVLETMDRNYRTAAGAGLVFCLLTDFADSATQVAPGDGALAADIRAGMAELAARHGQTGSGTFIHLHRPRRFNAAEGVWMGWERKRGKVMEMNRALCGDGTSSWTAAGLDSSALNDVVLIITMDSDSLLEAGGAAALAGTIAHPLNRPRLEGGRVTAGYGILCPRMAPSPESVETPFGWALFSDTLAGSARELQASFYQDAFGTDMFGGKAIYHLASFQAAVDGRIPENSVLSHDHLEGLFARAGLASDIILYEKVPATMIAWRRRQHRWVRGDFQVARWAFPHVPSATQARMPSPLSALDRWKLVNNLIFHASPVFVLAFAITGWLGASAEWTGIVSLLAFGTLGMDVPIAAATAFITWGQCDLPAAGETAGPRPDSRLGAAFGTFLVAAARLILNLVLLLDYGVFVTDAIIRSQYRVWVSRRHLLEWNTASSIAAVAGRSGPLRVWREMAVSSFAALLLGAVFRLVRPDVRPDVAPFLLLWVFAPVLLWGSGLPLLRRKVAALSGESQV